MTDTLSLIVSIQNQANWVEIKAPKNIAFKKMFLGGVIGRRGISLYSFLPLAFAKKHFLRHDSIPRLVL